MMEFLLESLVRGYQHSVTLSILTACCSSSVAGVFFPRGGGGGVRVCGISFRNRILLHVLLFFFTGGPCYTRTDASSVLGFILH